MLQPTRRAPSPTRADPQIAKFAAYLRGHGVQVLTVQKFTHAIVAAGPVHAVESVFGVKLYNWRERGTGREFFANAGPVSAPPGFSSNLVTVLGLDDYAVPVPLADVHGQQHMYSAADLRHAYEGNPALQCGSGVCDGSGQTVAIYAAGGFNPKAIAEFDNLNAGVNLQSNDASFPNITVSAELLTGGAFAPTACTASSTQCGNTPARDEYETEIELDIEAVHAVAPGATIHIYEVPESSESSPGDAPGAYTDFINAVLSDGASVATISYGECETDLSSSEENTLSSLFADASSATTPILVASGDTGSSCQSGGFHLFGLHSIHNNEVSYPASDPNVTAVGGTSLQLNSNGSYQSESTWDDRNTSASGGGESGVFAKPTWQASPGVPGNNQGTKRWVPDIAAIGDAETSLQTVSYVDASHFPWDDGLRTQPLGGTSLSSPVAAALIAVYDQYATTRMHPALSSASATLYKIANLRDTKRPSGVGPALTVTPLIDVSFNGSSTADLCSPANPYWDCATGLGSLQIADLAHLLIPSVTATPQPGPADATQEFDTTLNVSAAAFPVGDQVAFDLPTTFLAQPPKPLCQAPADHTGSASCTIHLPAEGRLDGTQAFIATDSTFGSWGGTNASVPITSSSLLAAVRKMVTQNPWPFSEWTVDVLKVDTTDPTWVKFGIRALPGYETTVQGAYGVARWQNSAWKIYDLGNATVGCGGGIPPAVVQGLGLDCPPAGGSPTPPVPPTGGAAPTPGPGDFLTAANTLCGRTDAQIPGVSDPTDFTAVAATVRAVLAVYPDYLAKATTLATTQPNNADLLAQWITPEQSDYQAALPLSQQFLTAVQSGDSASAEGLLGQISSQPDHRSQVESYLTGIGLNNCATLEAK